MEHHLYVQGPVREVVLAPIEYPGRRLESALPERSKLTLLVVREILHLLRGERPVPDDFFEEAVGVDVHHWLEGGILLAEDCGSHVATGHVGHVTPVCRTRPLGGKLVLDVLHGCTCRQQPACS